MSAAIDTSVLVATIVATESHHDVCDRLIDSGELSIYVHGVAETFHTLTGGRRFSHGGFDASSVLEEDYLPDFNITTLTPTEMLRALRDAESRSVRGGAIFDYLHLVAARKAKATRLFTLNLSNFRSFHRTGDPDIFHP